MIDLRSEVQKPLGKPRSWGGNVARQTARRWSRKGCVNRFTGQIVYLETVWIGGLEYTSREAFCRFVERLNSPVWIDEPTPPMRPGARKARA